MPKRALKASENDGRRRDDLHIANIGERVGLERGAPLLFVLRIAPALALLGEHFVGGFLKGRDALRLAPLEQRVEPDLHLGADIARAAAGERQTDFGERAQADLAADAMFLHPAHPALRPSRLDDEIKAVAVA